MKIILFFFLEKNVIEREKKGEGGKEEGREREGERENILFFIMFKMSNYIKRINTLNFKSYKINLILFIYIINNLALIYLHKKRLHSYDFDLDICYQSHSPM